MTEIKYVPFTKEQADRNAVNLAVLEANNTELRRQNEVMRNQIDELVALVNEIPGIITAARLDAKAGIPTRYNYERAYKACEVRA